MPMTRGTRNASLLTLRTRVDEAARARDAAAAAEVRHEHEALARTAAVEAQGAAAIARGAAASGARARRAGRSAADLARDVAWLDELEGAAKRAAESAETSAARATAARHEHVDAVVAATATREVRRRAEAALDDVKRRIDAERDDEAVDELASARTARPNR